MEAPGRPRCRDRGPRLGRWRGLLLLALAPSVPASAQLSKCSDEKATLVKLEGPKVVRTATHTDRQHASVWAFDAPDTDLRVAVTPVDRSMDPDIALFARTSQESSCKFVLRAQDYGGDMLIVKRNTTQSWGVTRYFLNVFCRSKNCEYHVAFSKGSGAEDAEEIKIGESKTGVAYRGVPLHFFFVCEGECEAAAAEGTNRRLTISVWPRDATSVNHLTLLVRKGALPTTAPSEHMKATRGWFSGQVVGTNAEAGRFYISVLKKHGKGFMPFELHVRLPETVQKIPLNKPHFGAVGRNSMAFYTFKVDSPTSDIAVYLTKLDGDPDMSVSNAEVHSHPTPLSAQWQSKKVGDDELVIAPDDPKRKRHPTGWFVVGVHGYKNTAFSIIALTEPHSSPEDASKQQVVDWTELWLGLPQTFAASPGRAGNFLFYSQLKTSRVFVNMQTLEGPKPDACMAGCGSDPHGCSTVSPFAAKTLVSSSPQGTVSSCDAAKMQGANADTQATVMKPCSMCWYSLLVTSEGATNRTRFRILLGADGRAHPLVAGEAFRGHVDANDAAVLLVYDMSAEEMANRTKANSTMRIVMTTVYGDPMFAVRSLTEDGTLLFASNQSGRDYFTLPFRPGEEKTKDKTYYIVVWANSKHAQFRMQVSWSGNGTLGAMLGSGKDDLTGVGLPILYEGKAASGILQGKSPTVFLYEPVRGEQLRPSIRISLRVEKGSGLRLFVVPVRTGKNHSTENVKSALAAAHHSVMMNAMMAGWASRARSKVLTIPGSDPRYVQLGSGDLYAIAVLRLRDFNTTATFTIEVGKVLGMHELLATGVPVPGVVNSNEYMRFRITVAESGRHLAVALKLLSGDADLYLGFNASVGRGSSVLNSTLVGGDAIFLPAFGHINSEHCSREVMQKAGECVYFVAVLGVSKRAEFEISAVVPEGKPVVLGPNKDTMVMVPPRGHQYLLLPLEPLGRNMTFEIQTFKGGLEGVNVKVVSEAAGQHPGVELTNLNSDTAHFSGKKFAGVWSVRLASPEVRPLCKAIIAGQQQPASGCAAFVSLRATVGYIGKATLSASSMMDPDAQEVGSRPGGALLMLQAGVPSRGSLQSKKDVLCFGFRVPDTSADLSVMLTPLTDCTPIMQLEFPHKEDGGPYDRKIDTLEMDKRLGFTVARVFHTDSRFRAGVYYIWVRQLASTRCEFDVRAQLEVRESTADFAATGAAAPAMLLLNSPVFASGDRARYFLFTSQIDKAEEAAKRELLELRVTALSGQIKVAVAVLNNSASKNISKRDVLAGAFGNIQPVRSGSSSGAPRSFVCHVLERCGQALTCQLLLRVRSARAGRFADYLAVATDNSQGAARTSEVLLPGMPVRGCVGSACPGSRGNTAQYQLLINNPAARIKVRLSCQGTDAEAACGKVSFSADARPKLPDSMEERTYTPLPSDSKAEKELDVSAVTGGSPGQCEVPCVLLIRVEMDPRSSGAANYELSAAARGGYTLLSDGAEPTSAVARPSRPKYFLFDSRRKSPLLTISVKVPYDSYDPNMELVSMYILDCDVFSPGNGSRGVRPAKVSKLQDPGSRPSAENYRFRALPSSRGQLVAFIARGPVETGRIDEGRHCYYRIAVVSNRLKPVDFTIRGFDWHPGAPLMLGEPLEGVVDRRHTFSYQLAVPEALSRVALSLEVCSGRVRLRTGRVRATDSGADDGGSAEQSVTAEGGLSPTVVPVEDNRWIEISAPKGRYTASYVLTAEDPSRRVWLQPRMPTLRVTQEGTRIELAWSPARLFGANYPEDGAGGDLQPVAVYEVFYGRADISVSNTSTACGLYFDYRYKRAKRIFTKTRRTATISDLRPGYNYVFNVVARSRRTGHSVAYEPYRQFVFPEEGSRHSQEGDGASSGSFWEEGGPLILIGIAVGVLALVRPCCRGSRPSWRRFELELPTWSGRSARRYEAYSSTGTGTYAPPSVVGQTHYSQIR